MLASLTSKEWGWRKDQLMKVYKTLQLSLLTYVAPAWQPWAAPSRIEQLERCQNKALRVVTGQLKSTQVETLRREAGICNYRRCSPTSLLRRSQCTHPLNSNGSTALPLQDKGGLHQNVFMADRLLGCLLAARSCSHRPSTSRSHPPS